MNLELQISIGAVALALSSLLGSALLYKKIRNQRELLEFVGKQYEDSEEMIAKTKELLDTNAQRVAEQARRIAWLETRIRQPKQTAAAAEELLDEKGAAEPAKLNMTERRHRVITLASRGQNVETIAATLGMLPGEVELIINLNLATQPKK